MIKPEDQDQTEVDLIVEEFKALRAEIVLCLERRITIISFGLTAGNPDWSRSHLTEWEPKLPTLRGDPWPHGPRNEPLHFADLVERNPPGTESQLPQLRP
jgi:hypothetical protein